MGSGKLIRLAIKKHGIENFSKVIFHVFETEAEMNAKEAELVVVSSETYNLCDGGKGGWSHINRAGIGDKRAAGSKGGYQTAANLTRRYGYNTHFSDPAVKRKAVESRRLLLEYDGDYKETMKNALIKCRLASRTSTAKLNQKRGFERIKHAQGSNNSQFGTRWITNNISNAKISKLDPIPPGWKPGRKMKIGT